LHEVDFYFQKANNGYDWFISSMVSMGTAHAPIHVVSEKPKLMKLEWCT